MYFITTKRMLEVCFSAHPNIQYRTDFLPRLIVNTGPVCGKFLLIGSRLMVTVTL